MRCEMMMLVAPLRSLASAARIFSSVCVSTAESESSNTVTGVFCVSIRAMATRCFCPPESVTPRSPTIVSYPFAKPSMSSAIQAVFAASRIAASSAPLMPMFSAIVRENRNGSCSTTPTCSRTHAAGICARSTPPTVTRPSLGA